MNFFFRLKNNCIKKIDSTIELLVTETTYDIGFIITICLSVILATFGHILNSSVLLIISAFITPLLFPIIAIGLGVTLNDIVLLKRTFSLISRGFLISLLAAVIVATLFKTSYDVKELDLIGIYSEPSLILFFVAIVITIASLFFLSCETGSKNEFPNTALSIAFLPSLSACGIGIASFDFAIVTGSIIVLITNLLVVIFISNLFFSIFNYRDYNKTKIDRITEKEDKKLKEEEQKAKKLEKQDSS